MADRKKPVKQYPFPRTRTRPVTGPAYKEGMTLEDCRKAWNTYLRIVQNVRQMDLKPLNMKD